MRVRRQLVVIVVALQTVRRFWRRRERSGDPHTQVRYRVPPGEDQAALLGKLRAHGVSARPGVEVGEPTLTISLNTPGDRDRVREILRNASAPVAGDPGAVHRITFSDEA